MKLVLKRFGLLAIAFAVMIAFTPMFSDGAANAKSKIKLSKKTICLAKGAAYTLKVKGVKAKKVKKIKWKSSNKKIVKVTKKGKLKAKLTGKKIGKATITAKVKLKNKKKYKKLKCKVIVEKKNASNARALRTYILKKGKKESGDTNALYIGIGKDGTVFDGDTMNETTVTITANKKNNQLKFSYGLKRDAPTDGQGASITVDLVKGKTGSGETHYWNDYGDSDQCDITITPSAYTKAGNGLTIDNALVERNGLEESEITNEEIADAKDRAKLIMQNAFAEWDTLIKAKKIKNNKVQLTMNNIGFSKY